MRFSPVLRAAFLFVLLGSLVVGGILGCSKKAAVDGANALLSPDRAGALSQEGSQAGPATIVQDGSTPPSGLVTVSFGSDALTLWPYTGKSYDGTPSDPVNVIFAGNVDPVKIRAALLSLDGDRTAFGLPDAYPFNATWTDAIGDVQTNYSESEGWQGSVIQLQMGQYEPIRAHLRLWRTGKAFGSGGTWTVGAAHFEVLIPGTADHEVISWEVAQQMVFVDLYRSGLLDQAAPFTLSGIINAAPSFRAINPAVYNGLPDELKALIGGPAGTATEPVPIGSDGQATIFNVVGEPAPKTGDFSSSFALTSNQAIPRPICSDGPLDWVLISGPVTLSRTTTVDAYGLYEYHSQISGHVSVTPLDVLQDPPAPSGASFQANVLDVQQGTIDPARAWAMAESKRIAPMNGGAEFLMMRLRVSSQGMDSYRASERCLAPQP